MVLVLGILLIFCRIWFFLLYLLPLVSALVLIPSLALSSMLLGIFGYFGNIAGSASLLFHTPSVALLIVL